jgi:hypothetical protein
MITNTEIKLIDKFILTHDIKQIDIAMFSNIVCNSFPTWRAEQICGYEFGHKNLTISYNQYIKGETNE